MDNSLILGLLSVVITYLVAPRLDRKWKAREAAKADVKQDRKDELEAIREENRDLRDFLNSQLAEYRVRETEKDARIDLLEEKIRGLQMQVDMFRAGLAHPPGFILLPRNVWIGLRARLGDQLPPGPFVGEDDDHAVLHED